MKLLRYIPVILAAGFLFSCSKEYLDTEYTRYLGEAEVAEVANKNPDAFLNGAWTYMVAYGGRHDSFGQMTIAMYANSLSEDMTMPLNGWFGYDYQFDYRDAVYVRTSIIWTLYYALIEKADSMLDLFPEGGTSANEKAFLGQAHALRGMSYYYLALHYQHVTDANGKPNLSAPGVPIMYAKVDGKSEEEMDKAQGRNTLGEVYALVEKDLTEAVTLLKEARDGGFVRANKDFIDYNVANGLLARYYMLSQQWQKAADAAAEAHKGYTVMPAAELSKGFMSIDNVEWMWGFAHNTETQTAYASFFSHMCTTGPGYGKSYPMCIDARLYSYIPDSDARKALFNGPKANSSSPTAGGKQPYANYKFGDNGSWTMVYPYMRASEMILTEAEAYCHLNQGEKAAQVLKELMAKRQSDWNESSVLLDDVLLQRRIELWGEGFSYFDLKRLNMGIDRNYSGTNHPAGYRLTVEPQDVRWNYQIPRAEMQENKHLTDADQNE